MSGGSMATFDDATLEGALRSLAGSIDWPAAAPVTPSGTTAGPDIATRVRVRLTAGERPRTTTAWWRPTVRSWRRALVFAIIALLGLAIVAGAAGLGLPGLRFIFGQPPASRRRRRRRRRADRPRPEPARRFPRSRGCA